MKKNTASKKTEKLLYVAGAAIAAVILLGGSKAQAATGSATGTIIVTDHDKSWDYKYENGTWYTRKKGAADWIHMQSALTPDNYKAATDSLTNHLKTKGIS